MAYFNTNVKIRQRFFNKIMMLFILFIIIFSSNIHSIFASTKDFSYNQLKFRATNYNLNGNPKIMQDSTWISFDSTEFKPLLFTTAKIEIDTTDKNNFKISGPFVLQVKVGDSDFQPIWQYDSIKTVTININQLLSDSGLEITYGSKRILVDAFPHQVLKFSLRDKPMPDSTNNSYVAINSIVYVPETADGLKYKLPDSIKVKITEQGNLLSSFIGNIDTSFYLRGYGYEGKGLNLKYDSTNKNYSIFGKIIYKLDSNFIPCTLGDTANPGLTYNNGLIEKIDLMANDTFRLFGLKMKPEQLHINYSKLDSTFKLFGKISIEVEQSTISLKLGDSTSPGCVAKDDKVLSLRASVADTFSIKKLLFKPENMSFAFDNSDNKRYFLYGSVMTYLKGDSTTIVDSLEAQLGTEAQPGFEIMNGELTQLNFSITKEFKLKNLSFKPDNVGFSYIKATQDYSIYGRMEVGFDSTSYRINAGTLADPGININQGKLTKLKVAIDDTIKVKGLQIKPNQLTFKYDTTSNKTFSIFGSALVLLKSDSTKKDSILCTLGDESSPGFVINDGLIQDINISVGGEFELKKLKFEPDNFTFKYDRQSKHYEMFGDLKVSVDSTSIKANFGNDENPGIIISGNQLTHLSFAINDTFQIRKLKIKPDTLTFVYDNTTDKTFKIYGNANVFVSSDTTSKDTLKVNLGNVSKPGILISDGIIEDVNFGISSKFKLNRLEFEPKELTFQYDRASNFYEIFGQVDVSFDSTKMNVYLGTDSLPGIIIQNGLLTQINIGVTDTFSIRNLKFEPTKLTFFYEKSDKIYKMFGDLKVILSADTIDANLGTIDKPGISIKNGILQNINIGFTGDFKLFGLEFQPKALTFVYDKSNKYYEIYGEVDTKFENDTINALLGNENKPGIIIKNSKVEQIVFGLTSDIKIAGVEFKTNGLTFQYDHPNNYYEMFGTVGLNLEGESLTANLGNETTPGFIIQNGKLLQFDIGITSDIKFGGFEVSTNNAGISYVKGNPSKYVIFGTLNFKELWNVTTTLGDPNQPGTGLELLVSNGHTKVKLDDFSFEAKHVNFGGINFNDILVKYSENNGNYAVDVDVDVAFPAGFEIAGVVAFEEVNGKFRLDSIDLDFEASGANPGIEIPETGIFIVGINGGVNRLGQSNDFQFKGGIALTLGGQISIGGNSYELLRIEGEATIDKYHLELTDKIFLAAMKKDGKWTSYLGEGIVDLNINWSQGTYVVQGGIYFLNDGDEKYVDFTAEAYYYSTGTFGALGEADLYVPKQIPIIGGKQLGSVDAALRYNKHDLDHSFAAGWIDLGSKIKAGIEYNFGTKKVKKIGSKDIDNLQKDVEQDASADNIHYDFTIGENVNSFSINITPTNPTYYAYLMLMMRLQGSVFSLTTPTPIMFNYFDLSRIIIDSFDKNGSGTYNTTFYDITVDSVKVNGIALHFNGTSVDNGELIIPGQYSIHTMFPKSYSGMFDVQIQQHYLPPSGKLNAKLSSDNKTVQLGALSNIFINDTATITFYQNTEKKYNGTVLQTIPLSSPKEGAINIVTNYSFVPAKDSILVAYDSLENKLIKSEVLNVKEYYYYAVINDGSNSPYYTDFTDKVYVDPDIIANVYPENTRIKKVENKIQGISDLGLALEYDDKIKDHYRISFYYDVDTSGFNGYAIPNLQNLTFDDLEHPDSVYSFIYDDLTKIGSGATFYIYTKITNITAKNSYKYGLYSSAVNFDPMITVTVNYNNNDHAPASMISVWLDMNNNGKYDSGVDQIKTTDPNGKCGFFVANDGKYTFGLILTGDLQKQNSNIANKVINVDIQKNNSLTFYIKHQPIKINGSFKIWGAYLPVDPSRFSSYGSNSNYVFVDYNLNGKLDKDSEPMEYNNSSGSFSFNVNQPNFMIYYVDNLYINKVPVTYDLIITGGKWNINGNDYKNISYSPYWGTYVDFRTKDGSTNSINTTFNGSCRAK